MLAVQSSRFWGLRIWALGFRVQGLGSQALGFNGYHSFRFRVWGLGFISACRVYAVTQSMYEQASAYSRAHPETQIYVGTHIGTSITTRTHTHITAYNQFVCWCVHLFCFILLLTSSTSLRTRLSPQLSASLPILHWWIPMVYSEPQKVGTRVQEDCCQDPLYFILRA